MKLHQLQYLVAVAERGGMRAAAMHLGVSATAVSRALIELENEAGLSLLERRSDGIAMTPAGNKMLEHARLITRQINEAGRTLETLRGTERTRLTVGVTPWIAQSLLGPAVREFIAMRPDVQLDISESLGTSYRTLRDGTLDLAIGMAPAPQESTDLQVRPLFSYGQVVICRHGHALASARRLRDLSRAQWLFSRELDQHTELVMHNPHNLHYVRSWAMALTLVRATDLLTVCPWPLVETEGMRGAIHAMHLLDELPETLTAVLMRHNAPTSGAIHAFLECFLKTVSQMQKAEDPATRRLLQTLNPVSGG